MFADQASTGAPKTTGFGAPVLLAPSKRVAAFSQLTWPLAFRPRTATPGGTSAEASMARPGVKTGRAKGAPEAELVDFQFQEQGASYWVFWASKPGFRFEMKTFSLVALKRWPARQQWLSDAVALALEFSLEFD